jgi:Exo70 exocyst complex subunit
MTIWMCHSWSTCCQHCLRLTGADGPVASVMFRLVLSMQPLAAVFMMNNLHYMVKTVESSEALTVLGEEWIEQHKDQVCS